MAARLQRSVLALQQQLVDASNQIVSLIQKNVELQNNIELSDDLVKTDSYTNADNNQAINIKRPMDDSHTYHLYDSNGPTAETLQYLQLTQNVQYPTNSAATFSSTYYEDASSAYMYGISIQNIFYNTATTAADLNKLTRREMFNILQDLGQINQTTPLVDGNTGFSNFWEVWNKGFADKNDPVPSLFGSMLGLSEASILSRANGGSDLWNWGNHAIIWRLDLSSNQVISRPLVNMSKAYDPSGSWIVRAVSRGPIASFGDGRFALTIQNFTQNGIMVFDKNLNPLTIISQSSYNTFSRTVAPDENDYQRRSQLAANVQEDQFNSCLIKKFYQRDLSGITYTSVIDNSPINVCNTPDGNAYFIYVSTSSQSQYDSQETTGGYLYAGALTLLSDYRWNQARGKVIQYSYYRDASNNWKLEPVNVFYTCPDLYKAGDIIQIDSFTKDPTTQQYQPLKFVYPLYDNRSSTLIGVGTYRDASAFEDTFNGQSYNQTILTDGSNGTLPITSGLQKLAINIFDVSGGTSGLGDIATTAGGFNPAGSKLKGKKFYQDVYGSHYIKLNDGTNDYWRQSSLGVLNQIPTDASVNFYLTTSPRKYVDLVTNITYTDNGSGEFLNSGLADPNVQCNIRKRIMNNCLCTRYMFSPYDFDPSANGIRLDPSGSGRTLLADGTLGILGCPFSDAYDSAAFTFGPNPQVPPFGTGSTQPGSTLNANGAKFIKPEFYFPNNHVYDSTQYYYSRPYSLIWRDLKHWIGAFRVAGATAVNPFYGKRFIDLSGALVAEYVRLCQTAQGSDPSQYDVQVITSGNTYTDLSGTDVVPNGTIVFKVKGSVFNGQPLVATINPSSAGVLTLSKIAADRLNIVGSGVYGSLSYYIDEFGNHHLVGGAGNTNVAPLTDQFYSSEWGIKYISNQIQTILGGGSCELSSIISRSTLVKLGFENVDWNANPQPNYHVFEHLPYKTSIIDNSGQILLDITQRGLNKFSCDIGRYSLGYYRSTTQKGINSLGNSFNYIGEVAVGHEYVMPLADPTGKTDKWSGKEYLECFNLYLKCIEIKGRCTNPRMNRVVSARPFILNAKNLELEHIVVSSVDQFEIYSTFSRSYTKVLDDVSFYDSGSNRDEVGGQVTAGDLYFSGCSKQGSRTYLKSDVSSPTLTQIGGLKSYPSDTTRKNFSLTKFTKLGKQDNLTIPDGPLKYGSSSNLWDICNGLQILAGNNHYIGKYNNKDLFLFSDCPFRHQDSISPHIIIPILPGIKYNNFEDNEFIFKTDDGAAYVLPMTNGYGGIPNPIDRPRGYKLLIAYTRDDNGNTVPVWYSTYQFEYFNNLWNRTFVAAAQMGITSKNCTIVNDIIFMADGRHTYLFNTKNGELLGKLNGDDYEALEKNYRPLGWGASAATDYSSMGCISSANGMIHIPMGYRRGFTNSSWGRRIATLQIKRNDKYSSFPLSTINLGSGNLDIVFKPEDTLSYNNNKFILISSFLTQDKFGRVFSGYANADSSYNMMYYSGITGFAINANSDLALRYFNNKTDLSEKIVNGGSWYQYNNLTFNQIKSSILFLYAGPIPSKSAKHSPYPLNDRQVLESKSIRNQKMILSEINRIKNGNTYPYPDNGYYFEGSSRQTSGLGYNPYNTMRYTFYKDASDNSGQGSFASATLYNPSFNYFNWTASLPAQSQVYNQPLGYTDVGTGRPFAGQSGYDQYGTPL